MKHFKNLESLSTPAGKTSKLSTRKSVIRQIQQLHRRRVPLNISAVKRSHPKLLEQAYAMRPFWGWKRALEDAGLSYETINIELRDYVECKICGRLFAMLPNHLIATHQVTSQDYHQEYPGAELVSEVLRAGMEKSIRRHDLYALPRWEKIWTPEYILDRLAELRRRNFPITRAWAHDHESNLLDATIDYFGSWDEALRRMGSDPAKVRLNPLGWHNKSPWFFADKAAIIAELRRRKATGEGVTSQGILHIKYGPALYNHAQALFGSWSGALIAAGLDPWSGFRSSWGKANEADILAEIRRRERAGESVRCREIQKEKWGKPLLRRATALFGSWSAALLAVGIAPKGGRSPWPEADKATVLAELRRRQRAGETLAFGAMAKEVWGLPLRQRCESLFGSWVAALRAAGIEPGKQYTPWARADKTVILAEVHRRERAHESLRFCDVWEEKWGPPLLNRCKTLFGSWRFAVLAAGLPPPKGSTSPFLRADKSVILEEIRRRAKARESLRVQDIAKEQWGQALLRRAVDLFGSWRSALLATGIHVTGGGRSKRTWHLPVEE